jgi:hypothetical protein
MFGGRLSPRLDHFDAFMLMLSHSDFRAQSHVFTFPAIKMLASIRTAAVSALRRQINRFFPPIAPQLSLTGVPFDVSHLEEVNNELEDSIWFAVPKKKVSRGKKRMKTTLQKRIKLKNHIVIGE